MIRQYGKAVTLVVVTSGTYDPATSRAPITAEDLPIKALVQDYNGKALESDLVERGDKQIYIAGAEATPKNGDRVVIDGAAYLVKNVLSYYSGESIALFEVQGRA